MQVMLGYQKTLLQSENDAIMHLRLQAERSETSDCFATGRIMTVHVPIKGATEVKSRPWRWSRISLAQD